MSVLPFLGEYPQPGLDVVLRISAQWLQAGATDLNTATTIHLPPIWLAGKQVLCLSLTDSGRIKAEIVEGGQ